MQENTISIKVFQAINAIIGALILGYIVHYFVDTNRFAEYKLQGINKDLSEKQVIIKNQNNLNEVMFKEIHHRVKNNLQIISSLLKLQSFETENEEVQTHFNEAIGRIRSMALIHEKMYSNDDLANINLECYLFNLSKDICESLKAGDDVKLSIQSELDKVDVKSMVPISLIFNELITNSLKHGIKHINNGEITIEVKSNPKETTFSYADNGVWVPPVKEGTFGLELLETLTQQLDGQISRSTENGTRFIFTFKTETLFYS
jgi:two-component sensor histidine kinase